MKTVKLFLFLLSFVLSLSISLTSCKKDIEQIEATPSVSEADLTADEYDIESDVFEDESEPVELEERAASFKFTGIEFAEPIPVPVCGKKIVGALKNENTGYGLKIKGIGFRRVLFDDWDANGPKNYGLTSKEFTFKQGMIEDPIPTDSTFQVNLQIDDSIPYFSAKFFMKDSTGKTIYRSFKGIVKIGNAMFGSNAFEIYKQRKVLNLPNEPTGASVKIDTAWTPQLGDVTLRASGDMRGVVTKYETTTSAKGVVTRYVTIKVRNENCKGSLRTKKYKILNVFPYLTPKTGEAAWANYKR